ncbi:hypothetical protein OROMI_032001 [Orobanche minor]
MEGNLSSRNMMRGNNSYGGFDLQIPVRVHHHQQPPPQFASHHQHNSNNHRQSLSPSSMAPLAVHENFPLTIGTNQENHTLNLTEYNKPDRVKSASDEDEPSLNEDPSKLKKSSSLWHRVKWTDAMVRLLITAVSYISEDTASESVTGPRRKYASLQKKGKWKSVSKVMAERGHVVSPQQCEDKFNDLNKRYKRLNEILGRGTSCEVVENPSLLDIMDHISEKAKEEVRKILSSKHLHYEEMCSYHNGNRLHLPPDPELQHSLRLALRSRDEHDDNHDRHLNGENDEIDEREECEFDEHGEFEESSGRKVKRQCPTHEDFSFKNSPSPFDCNTSFDFQDSHKVCGENVHVVLEKNRTSSWNFQLEEQRLHLESQMLELEKEKFKWQRFCRKKDRELEMRRMEIERMKLENERMALELRRKEMGIDE